MGRGWVCLHEDEKNGHHTHAGGRGGGPCGVGAIEVLTLLGAREWTKFAVLAVTFAAILLGAYWFVLASDNRR